jgi:hypothetical protein
MSGGLGLLFALLKRGVESYVSILSRLGSKHVLMECSFGAKPGLTWSPKPNLHHDSFLGTGMKIRESIFQDWANLVLRPLKRTFCAV